MTTVVLLNNLRKIPSTSSPMPWIGKSSKFLLWNFSVCPANLLPVPLEFSQKLWICLRRTPRPKSQRLKSALLLRSIHSRQWCGKLRPAGIVSAKPLVSCSCLSLIGLICSKCFVCVCVWILLIFVPGAVYHRSFGEGTSKSCGGMGADQFERHTSHLSQSHVDYLVSFCRMRCDYGHRILTDFVVM